MYTPLHSRYISIRLEFRYCYKNALASCQTPYHGQDYFEVLYCTIWFLPCQQRLKRDVSEFPILHHHQGSLLTNHVQSPSPSQKKKTIYYPRNINNIKTINAVNSHQSPFSETYSSHLLRHTSYFLWDHWPRTTLTLTHPDTRHPAKATTRQVSQVFISTIYLARDTLGK